MVNDDANGMAQMCVDFLRYFLSPRNGSLPEVGTFLPRQGIFCDLLSQDLVVKRCLRYK